MKKPFMILVLENLIGNKRTRSMIWWSLPVIAGFIIYVPAYEKSQRNAVNPEPCLRPGGSHWTRERPWNIFMAIISNFIKFFSIKPKT